MARMSWRRPGALWFIHMRRALGWSFTEESRKPEASCLCQRFVLLSAARIASTQFLSCCHQSLRFTRRVLGQHRQSRWCPILLSGKLMCRHRNCFIECLVWTSISFTSLALSAGGSTSSASDHAGQDLHEAERRAGSAACSSQESNT